MEKWGSVGYFTMVKCRWCRSKIIKVFDRKSSPDWGRWQCTKCQSFGYISPPTDEQLSQVYADAWEKDQGRPSFATGSTDYHIATSILASAECRLEGLRCLEYGGGSGYFARAILSNGCKDLTVIEPFGSDPKIADILWLKDIRKLDRNLQYDCIFMIEVIEHLTDPVAILTELADFLSPKGLVYITTPNARCWRARIQGFEWREVQNPVHINIFSNMSLKICLAKAGFSQSKRIFRPVEYSRNFFENLALRLTQRMGIDGSLKMIARK